MSADSGASETSETSEASGTSDAPQSTASRGQFPGQIVALRAAVAAINHLLSQHPNAGHRLAAHAGSLVRVGIDEKAVAKPASAQTPAPTSARPPTEPLLPQLWVSIDQHGQLLPAEQGDAQVQLLVRPSVQAGIDFLTEGANGLNAHLRVEGSVLLAGLIGEIIRDLRWDYEDDLARVVGDIPARRIGQAVATGQSLLSDFLNRAGRQFAAQTQTDNSPVTGRSGFNAQRDLLAQLDKRLDAIERKLKNTR